MLNIEPKRWVKTAKMLCLSLAISFVSPLAASADDAGNTAIIKTNFGTMEVALRADTAPNNVQHFKDLVEQGRYDGMTFYRVVDGAYIQGGIGYDEAGDAPRVANEANPEIKHVAGTVGFAWQDLADKDSGAHEIYILLADLPFMDDWGFTNMGQVVSGLDVLADIGKTPVQDNFLYWDGQDLTDTKTEDSLEVAWHLPLEPVVIQSITLR